MTTYQELLAQRTKLDLQIDELRKSEAKTALETIQGLIADYEFTAKDVFSNQAQKKIASPAKYHDPATGAQWSGRGKAPKWLAGKNLEDFRIVN